MNPKVSSITNTRHNAAVSALYEDEYFSVAVAACCDAVIVIGAKYQIKPIDAKKLLNLSALYGAWVRIFASGAKKPLHLLNESGILIESSPQDIEWQVKKIGGNFCYIVDLHYKSTEVQNEIEQEVHKAVTLSLLAHVKLYRQRVSTSYIVDMFATESKIVMTDSCAKVSLIHSSFNEFRGVEPAVVNKVITDFTEHFPLWPEFIAAIAAARFASDRREGFMWLQACSGWGKGLLIAVLDELGILVELSVKEIEAAFEGRAVGISPDSFVRSWVVNVDEFKTIKSEIKQINNKISLSPKFQLKADVPVYFKLFTSAEDVASLTGSEGVEEQFSKRFIYYKPASGSIDDRLLFQSLGKSVYLKALASGTAKMLNEYVKQMRFLGSSEAAKVSDKALSVFNSKYSLSHHFDSLDNSIDEYAKDLKKLIQDLGRWLLAGEPVKQPIDYSELPRDVQQHFRINISVGHVGDEMVVLLKRPTTIIKAWLNFHVDRGQISKVSHKVNDLIRLVNDVGSVTKSKRYTEVTGGKKGRNSQSVKGVAVILTKQATNSGRRDSGSAGNVSFL